MKFLVFINIALQVRARRRRRHSHGTPLFSRFNPSPLNPPPTPIHHIRFHITHLEEDRFEFQNTSSRSTPKSLSPEKCDFNIILKKLD